MKGIVLLLVFGLLIFGCTSREQLLNQTANTSVGTGSDEVSCDNILTSDRTIVVSTIGGLGYPPWTDAPQLQSGFSSSMVLSPNCYPGGTTGQNVNHLYCQPDPIAGNPKAQRTNISKDGVIESQECYVLVVKELAPGGTLPAKYQKYTDMYQTWQIVNVSCQRC